MSNLSSEDIEGILEELELKWELDSIDKLVGRGGFGSVHQARSVICLYAPPEGLHSRVHPIHSHPGTTGTTAW